MNTKTNRKNKTKQVIKWPETHFTIDELNQLNLDFVNITLRVRLTNAIANRQVVKLGVRHLEKGRPRLVFACAPVVATTLESARNSGIHLDDVIECLNSAPINSTECGLN